jgi:hypothetical protein
MSEETANESDVIQSTTYFVDNIVTGIAWDKYRGATKCQCARCESPTHTSSYIEGKNENPLRDRRPFFAFS